MNVVLVTGPSGLVGRHALGALGGGGYEIHAACRNPLPDIAPLARWHAVDLMDHPAVERLCGDVKATHLLHLAWCASGAAYRTDPANPAYARCSDALARGFFGNGGRRAVLAGTSFEHQAQGERSLYASSKIAAAAAMSVRAGERGGSFAWGRIFLPYGPYDAPHRLVPSVIDALLSGRVATCSPGTQIRDFVHAADVGTALAALLRATIEGPADIGTGTGVTVRDAVEEIARQIGRPDLVRFDGPAPAQHEAAALVAKPHALSALGWRPLALSDGLARTIEWHRARLPA